MGPETGTNGVDWFERIAGFVEGPYHWTQERLHVEDGHLIAQRDGSRHRIGRFEMISLAALREMSSHTGRSDVQVRPVIGDARALHADAANAGATFQVASQFNALEMIGPDITPEHGVTRYAIDRTQGPACAMAAGAGTIWRNYLIPVAGRQGQSADHQLNGLSALGNALSEALGMSVSALWSMRNGYALCTAEGLTAIAHLLKASDETHRDWLRSLVCVGWHRDVDVTDLPPTLRHQVTQVYCAALPVAYSRVPAPLWEPFARLILEAAYEATLRAASISSANGGTNRVLLTGLGAGAFGNEPTWIADALDHALGKVEGSGLEVLLVGYQGIPMHFQRHHRQPIRQASNGRSGGIPILQNRVDYWCRPHV